jgi:dihydropyrimidinase
VTNFDIVIRGGTVVTATGSMQADVGVVGETVAEIGQNLPSARTTIDASGKLVLPGGVDTHAHIEQVSASGLMTADDFESATTSAAFGGTTTVVSFAAQHRGMNLDEVVADYHVVAKRGAVIDYAFHMIVADPTAETLAAIPALVRSGHSSIKVYMTYDRLRLDDAQILDVLFAARAAGAFVCVHAENHGLIDWLTKRLLARGYTAPKYGTVSHPRSSEEEAFRRLITLAEFADQPVMIFHVSTAEGASVIREARQRGVKVFAETCPHYLLLTAADVDKPGLEGAIFTCSPPLRSKRDQEALWEAIASRDIQVISSDHAPYRYDETGKLRFGVGSRFDQIANGFPGLETRLPLMFDAIVTKKRMSVTDFVDLTSTQPAKMYGLFPRKGAIAAGGDADIVIWDPTRSQILSAASLHDRAGNTPFEGCSVTGYPVTVLRRGEIIVDQGERLAKAGSGCFIGRDAGPAASPRGAYPPEFELESNFGAKLQ